MIKIGKKVKYRLHIALLILVFSVTLCCTTSIEVKAEEKESSQEVKNEIDKIIEDFKLTLPDGYEKDISASDISESLGVKRIICDALAGARANGGEIATFLITLLGIGMISSLASVNTSELGVLSSKSVGVVSAALLFGQLMHLVFGVTRSLTELNEFFSAVIPVCLAVNSLGVSPTTATTQAVGMGVTLGAYTFICDKLLLPFVSAIFATSAASSFDSLFCRISKSVKGMFLWSIGIFTALVGATFSLQSVISSGADSAAIRSARYAISGSIPLVGGAVSSVLGVLSGGVSYAKGIIGGGAIAVIVSVILSPLVTLLLYRLCLKAGVFFASISSTDGCAEIIASFLGALDTLIAVYSMTSVIYIAELVAFLKGGAVGIA